MRGFLALSAAILSLAAIGTAFAADPAPTTGAAPKLVWRPVRPSQADAPAAKSVNDSTVRNATYEQDVFDDVPAPPAKIRLTAGNSGVCGEATSDPFGDSLQSVQSRKVTTGAASVEPEMIDSLPPPAPTREAPPTLQIDPPAQSTVKREPAELNPPDPLKSGALKHTMPTYQSEPFIPSTPDDQLNQIPGEQHTRLAAVRGVRSRADARRGDSCLRGSLRRCDPRGIRPIGGDGCDDGKSLEGFAQARERWVCRCQGRRSASSARTTSRCRPDRWAK